MDKLDVICSTITKEADSLLYKLGLKNMLNKYGKVFITGSYYLNLMTWRDLDLYVDSSNMSNEDFFKLGYEITTVIQPQRMQYRNEFIGETQGLPKGLYWGVYTNIIEPNTWKIDIWAVDSKQLSDLEKQIDKLKKQIDSFKRSKILEIKNSVCNHPLYRFEFKSIDIYQAVIEESIVSTEGFREWLKDKKKITL